MSTPSSAAPGRKVSWHSTTGISPTNRQSLPRTLSSREEEAVQSDHETDGDENTAILTRPNGGDQSYNTQGPRPGSGAVKSSGNDGSARKGNGRIKKRRDSRANGSASQDHEEEDRAPWWKRALEKYGSVELENKGSVARDHLALERTFLAWLRTSLSFASIGIAVTQLFRLNTSLQEANAKGIYYKTFGQTPIDVPVGSGGESATIRLRHVGKPLGATFIGIGIVTLLIGFHRYFESQHYVIRGKFPASRGSIVLIAIMSGALIVASFVVVLTISPRALATNPS